jgi:hypothetical protein
MTAIACPRCETTFETQATTATRCRSCRSVVHVSRGTPPGSPRSPRLARGTWSTEEADGETSRTETIVIVLAIAVIAYLFVRAWRRRKASGQASGVPGVPLASVVHRPREPAVATCPLCTTGVARCAVVGCPMAA